MLKITKIFNNNAALVENEYNTELVVVGKGISFNKKIGDLANECDIEKSFSLNKHVFAARLMEILSEVPQEYFCLTNLIVNYADKKLSTPLASSIYVSLPDHLYHAVERVRNRQIVPNRLTYEIQRLYKTEYEIGRYAVDLTSREMKVEMNDDEASFIALHIFNAGMDNSNMSDTYRTMQIVKDILNIVGYHFNRVLDVNDLNYSRFVIHLQYFAQRIFSEDEIPAVQNDFLFRQTKEAYPHAYHCVEKIGKYLERNFGKKLNNDEQLYLLMHIQRIIRY